MTSLLSYIAVLQSLIVAFLGQANPFNTCSSVQEVSFLFRMFCTDIVAVPSVSENPLMDFPALSHRRRTLLNYKYRSERQSQRE